MSMDSEVIDQNIIVVQDCEIPFFEDFTKKRGIYWSHEEKRNKILSLSKSYVGYITTPARVLLLKPKYEEIGFEHIMRLYLFVHGYRPTDSAAILDVSNSNQSVDIADLFINNLNKNIHEGIIRTYKRKKISAKSLKGHIDYCATYLNVKSCKKKAVSTQISTLSVENSYNALIQTALKKLQHTRKYVVVATELSMYFEGSFDNITNASSILEQIDFNSNTSRYRRTLTYAAMIIDQLSYSDTGSTVGTDSFIINFDRLFEDFVAKILKEIPEKKDFSTWNSQKKFAEVITPIGRNEEREYQPDLLYKFIAEDEKYDYSPTAFAVLDVKNKAYGLFKNADIYQISMYSRLLHSDKSLLLYPSFQRRKPLQLSLDNTAFSPSAISACFVNIADDSGEKFLSSINEFADIVVKTISNIPT